MDAPWWQRAVIYQIYPRSFADASGDGIGDLAGIQQHLDHLTWLGVDGLWLSPIYPSPMADFGYDVANYTDVDPLFGTLTDADDLVAAAHRRNLKVLLDWVPNHTSNRHPWFMASRGSRTNPYRDWYLWRDEPNNWRQAFAPTPAWTLDERTGQYYLHLFLPEQPDLNWNNPAVRRAMHDVLRFWLDRDVDGFRADVVHLIGKDPALPDDQPVRSDSRVSFHEDPHTHRWLREIRAVLDGYDGDRAMVGEVNLRDPMAIAPYAGPDQLHMAFDFRLLDAAFDATAFRTAITATDHAARTHGTWPTVVLGNHDQARVLTRYDGREDRARVAAVVLLTVRGTPFLFAGDELGLADAVVPPERRVDPGGRDGCRAPIPWNGRRDHGWNGDDPWLPWPPEPDVRNVAAQRRDPDSMAALYRRLLRRRRDDPALQLGDLDVVGSSPDVLSYERTLGDERRRVVANFSDQAQQVAGAHGWSVLVATRRDHEDRVFDGTIGPCSAVVLGVP